MTWVVVTVGILATMAWVWRSERRSERHELEELDIMGKAIHMTLRNALDCVSLEKFNDAKQHIAVAHQRWVRIDAAYPRTRSLAKMLLNEISIVEKVVQYAEEGMYQEATQQVLFAASNYFAYALQIKKAQESVPMDDEE
jgi:hypothetical protein